MARLRVFPEPFEAPAELPGHGAEIRPARLANRNAALRRPEIRIDIARQNPQREQPARRSLTVRHELDATSTVREPHTQHSDQDSNLDEDSDEQTAPQTSSRLSIFERIRAVLRIPVESSPSREESPELPQKSNQRKQNGKKPSRLRTMFRSLQQHTTKWQFWRHEHEAPLPPRNLTLTPDLELSRSRDLRPPSPIPSLSPVSTMRYEMLEEDAVGFTVRPWSRSALRSSRMSVHTPPGLRLDEQKGPTKRASSKLNLILENRSPSPPARQDRRCSKAVVNEDKALTTPPRPHIPPKRMSIGTMLAGQLEEYEELTRSHNWEAITEDESDATLLSSTPLRSSDPIPSSTPPSSPPDRVAWFGARSKARKAVLEQSPSSMTDLEASERPVNSDRSESSSMHSSRHRLRPRPRTIAVDRHSNMESLIQRGLREDLHAENTDRARKATVNVQSSDRNEARASIASFRPARKQLGALFKELESARRDARRIEAAIARAKMKEEMERPEPVEDFWSSPISR